MDEESSDICSQINLLSSIQYQQTELSILAKQLQSKKDREKYIKVIEISKIIQAKLEYLQTQKKKSDFGRTSDRVNSFGQDLDKKNSIWSLNNAHSSSRNSSDHTCSSTTTTASSSRCSSSCGDNQHEDFPLVFSESSLFSPYRNHQTFHGHTYRVIDRVTSLQFQNQQLLNSAYNNRRPSAETILNIKKENDKKNQILYMKPTPALRKPAKKQQISFSPLPSTCNNTNDEEESEEEEICYTNATIHVAVRRDASLFKIEKVINNPLGTTVLRPVKNNDTSTAVKQQQQQQQQYIKKQIEKADVGLPKLPDSPSDVYDTTTALIDSESDLDMNTLPRVIHVHKKSHQSLKGLIKRSYQLNQYTVTKTNSTTISPVSNNLLFKTVNGTNGRSKLLLKVAIVSLASVQRACDNQERFGFTFWWQTTTEHRQPQQDDSVAKFALAPDSLVKEALATWIESQNAQSNGAVLLPSLSKSDEMLRDGRKIYVIYDTSLFPV